MKVIGIAVALVCIFLGWWTASLPNVSERTPGRLIVAYGLVILVLSLFGKGEVVRWILLATGLLLIVAYSLPMSFWGFFGLGD